MTFLFYLFITLFVLICATLCTSVLLQESKSFGLGASFGGDSGDSLFGTSTADVLKKFTAYMAAFFLLSCVMLSLWTSAIGRSGVPDVGPEIEEMQ